MIFFITTWGMDKYITEEKFVLIKGDKKENEC
jgi:hypothetical protein